MNEWKNKYTVSDVCMFVDHFYVRYSTIFCSQALTARPVYSEIQIREYFKNIVILFLENYFQFLAIDLGQCFLSMSFLLLWAPKMSEWQYW